MNIKAKIVVIINVLIANVNIFTLFFGSAELSLSLNKEESGILFPSTCTSSIKFFK